MDVTTKIERNSILSTWIHIQFQFTTEEFDWLYRTEHVWRRLIKTLISYYSHWMFLSWNTWLIFKSSRINAFFMLLYNNNWLFFEMIDLKVIGNTFCSKIITYLLFKVFDINSVRNASHFRIFDIMEVFDLY